MEKFHKKWTDFISPTKTWTFYIHFHVPLQWQKCYPESTNFSLVCKKQFNSTNKTEEWTECLTSQKTQKRHSWRKSTESIRWALSKKRSEGKPVVSAAQKELINLKRTKFENRMINKVDCFLGGFGVFTNNVVTFDFKSFWNYQVFEAERALYKSYGRAKQFTPVKSKKPIAIRQAETDKAPQFIKHTHAT